MARIIRGLKNVLWVALGKSAAKRLLTVFPDDVFIVSYPKSGNTWTRFLIGNFVYQHQPVTFANVESLVPSIYVHPDRVLRKLPRLLKSHEVFDPRYTRVIYIVRDPRDVAISYYHYALKRSWVPLTCTLGEFIARFMKPEFEAQFGTWAENVLSWIAVRRDSPNFLLLRYEDMLAHPEVELTKTAAFLNLDPTPERLQRAIRLSSADQMRELEKKEGQDWALTKGTRKDIPFVRTAQAGGWRTTLSQEDLARIENKWGEIMEALGYQLSTGSSTPRPGQVRTG